MGLSDFLFGKRLWTTKETTVTSTESEFGKQRTTKTEITTEKGSDGKIFSKTITTEETEK
jgi:hypothetical protein